MTKEETQQQIIQLQQLMIEYLRQGKLTDAESLKIQIESLKCGLNENRSILLG